MAASFVYVVILLVAAVELVKAAPAHSRAEYLTNLLKVLQNKYSSEEAKTAQTENVGEEKFIMGRKMQGNNVMIKLGRLVSECGTNDACSYQVMYATCDPRQDATCQGKSAFPSARHFSEMRVGLYSGATMLDNLTEGATYYVWDLVYDSQGKLLNEQQHREQRRQVTVPAVTKVLLE